MQSVAPFAYFVIVLVVVDVVLTSLVDVDVARVVTVTVGCFLTVVVLSTVDVVAGIVKVDFTVASSITTVVEGGGLIVDLMVKVFRLVDVIVDPVTVVFTVLVGSDVTVSVEGFGVEDCPCAEDEVIVIVTWTVEIGTVVVNVLVAREVEVEVIVISAPLASVFVMMSVMYSVGVVITSVEVVMKSVTVDVVDAVLDKGASKPRFAFEILESSVFEMGASKPRLALTGGIQLNVVVTAFFAILIEVDRDVMVVGLADSVVVPPSPTWSVKVEVLVDALGLNVCMSVVVTVLVDVATEGAVVIMSVM